MPSASPSPIDLNDVIVLTPQREEDSSHEEHDTPSLATQA